MASIVANRFLYNVLNSISGHTIKAAILDNGYTPDKDDNVFSDVSVNEVSGTGYTAGGATLANISIAQDDANDKAWIDCDNLTWSEVTFTNGRYLVLYDTSASNNILSIYDFGADKSPAGDDFQVNVNALGLLSFSQA